MERTMPPGQATQPPARPVPAPRTVRGTFSRPQSLTMAATSCSVAGFTTAAGMARHVASGYSSCV